MSKSNVINGFLKLGGITQEKLRNMTGSSQTLPYGSTSVRCVKGER